MQQSRFTPARRLTPESERSVRSAPAVRRPVPSPSRYDLEVVGLVENVFARPSSRWGHGHQAVLRDLDGNRYRCWSSRPLAVEEHRAYQLSGRVTAHDEHRGECETVLTRCQSRPARAD